MNYDADVLPFFQEHFQEPQRKCVLLAGLGFDPRTTMTFLNLREILSDRLKVILIRENRPSPDDNLLSKAQENEKEILAADPNSDVWSIDIFSDDNAVVGGRKVVEKLVAMELGEVTDFVIDLSAMSAGVGFPIVRYLIDKARAEKKGWNIHITTISNPKLDALISSEPNDEISHVHGFDLPNLHGGASRVRLWVPVISRDKMDHLKLIYKKIRPDDVCPVLPFPVNPPTKTDQLAWSIFSEIHAESLSSVLENEWGLEPRNFIFADERMPLDIYRTILRIDDERKPVFESFGGSTLVLSPLGTKVPSIGVLMAAIERNFPVTYVETLSHSMDTDKIGDFSTEYVKAHIWLYGRDAYIGDE